MSLPPSPLSLQLRGHQTARLSEHYQQPLGRILVGMGVMTPESLLQALSIQRQCNAPFHHVCLAEGFASAAEIRRAQAAQWAAIALSHAESPPDPACAASLDPLFCLQHRVIPWMRLGNTLIVATSDPEAFEELMPLLPETAGPVVMGLASESDIHIAIAEAHAAQLVDLAETAVPEELSCRSLHAMTSRRHMRVAVLAAMPLAVALVMMPWLFYSLAALWTVFTMLCLTAMKGAACLARLHGPLLPDSAAKPVAGPPPLVSILVPLFRERDIAATLITRLSRLTYPKSRLDVVLVLEAGDDQTRATLAHTELPSWMRTIIVPPGRLTTKPRALNYALRFCEGEIVGIYDAEDDPAPDQIEQVAARFRDAAPDVACLQGILDFYNPRANWLARCFTIEYAMWFRIVLPGLSRMGFAIPLGGTTLFFRRNVLEELGGWDAFNVTEDADLGMRLSRRGYRTEMVDTVTLEEANCRWWPWVRQRSRWLKGYMATYRVHMRRPRQLLRDLGWKRFIGFQVLFLGSLSQFVLAPVLWSFWLALVGMPHPILSLVGPDGTTALITLFLMTEALGLLIGTAAVAGPRHRGLMPWVPSLMFYFPLGAVAAYKALAELLCKPFYWDKTDHGHHLGAATVAHETATFRSSRMR